MDGMRNKITMINDESQVKLQDTMQKIVNDSNGDWCASSSDPAR